jgi:CO dehydrogenase maturation factor
MRAAFCGKGGSGKTTIASLFSRYLASKKVPLMVMDGDINQHLGAAFGLTNEELDRIPKLGNEIDQLKEYVAGSNPLVTAQKMIKTTPPGRGSKFLYFDRPNPIYERFEKNIDGIRFMTLGGFDEEKLGTTCFHSWTAAMNIFLNHFIDQDNEYFIGDMTAGADPFSTGLITRFDVPFLVAEPTKKSLAVYDQCKEYGAPFNMAPCVIGNKVEDAADLDYIRKHVGDDFVGCLHKSQFVRDYEKGVNHPIEKLEAENVETLEAMLNVMKSTKRDWDKYIKNNTEFHKRAADNWASAVYEVDLKKQIDEDFSYDLMLAGARRQ